MSMYTKIIDLQKLAMAWSHVKKNKPAAGIDNVTYEQYERDLRIELRDLQNELSQHTYETLPVKNVTLYKGEKSRTIALFSMRDKVVQQSLSLELTRIYDPRFSDSTFAYRPNKSALNGIDLIEKEVLKNKWNAVLKLDIQQFFDSICWDTLEMDLRKVIREEDVLQLIRSNATARILDSTGELLQKTIGIHQGSAIAPILSNIYMMEFDAWLSEQDVFYIRYSDDILILGKDVDQLTLLKDAIIKKLLMRGLELNDKKTQLFNLDEGVEFLGHAFNKKGKAIPKKAEDDLQERLETMWITTAQPIEEKLNKAAEIINGWAQYFREDRDVSGIIEYAVSVKKARTREKICVLLDKRKLFHNSYLDIAIYLAERWRKENMPVPELYEYEDYYQISDSENEDSEDIQDILVLYRKMVVRETEETATELMQLYADRGEYEIASFWMEKKRLIEEQPAGKQPIVFAEKSEDKPIAIHTDMVDRIMKLFAGREDIYSLESIGYGGKRQTELQLMPLTDQVLKEHIEGRQTVGTYIQRPNGTIKNIIVDIDVSKRVLLKNDRGTDIFKEYLGLAFETANEIVRLYRRWGLQGYIEYSGCRGYHVWLLLSEWVPVRYANLFCEILERNIQLDENLTMEFFPNKTRVKPGKNGQCLKIPYGRHGRTGEYSYFLDENGEKITEVKQFLDGIAKYGLSAIKRVLAANAGYSENGNHELTLDMKEFENVPDGVKTVLENCNLMKYLCGKAVKTGYLTHFERLSILYVFGHLGDDGHEFVHTIMSKTLNYQHQTTERFLAKLPDKPISCIKLRDQYKNITAEYGCSCSFKRTKNCYPSPVMHAISLAADNSDQITIPTSRTLTKENEKKVIDELNIHKKVEELAGRILNLKKQKRSLDSSVMKVETELCKIFDEHSINCLEIEMGLLVRRKKDERYEWLIEI